MTAPVTGVFLASMPWACRRAAVRLPQQVCTLRLALPFMLNQSPSSCVSESICSQCRLTILLQWPILLYTWLLMASLSYMQLATSTSGLSLPNSRRCLGSSSWRISAV